MSHDYWIIAERKTGKILTKGQAIYTRESSAKRGLSYWCRWYRYVQSDFVTIKITSDDILQLIRRESATTLEELCASVNDENHHEEIDFGGPVGDELL
ncbi:hypothetical protein ABND12_18050 [Paenibacillus larvae]